MSVEQLKQDLKDNMGALKEMGAFTTPEELVKHLRNSLWPMLEAFADELEEQDGCIEDLLNGSEDILQPETGGKFLACFASATMLVGELAKRLTPSDDPKLRASIAEFNALANDCIGTVQEITIPEVGDADDGDEDADEDDDEDADEAEED